VIGEKFPLVIRRYITHCNRELYQIVDIETDRISGYGDNAKLNQKSTQMCCICRASIYGLYFNIVDTAALCFSNFTASSLVYFLDRLNGSKGAVWFMARAFGQRIIFIGCHLTPKNYMVTPQGPIRTGPATHGPASQGHSLNTIGPALYFYLMVINDVEARSGQTID